MKQEINIENNVLDVKKFLTYGEAENVQSQSFWWNWALETGDSEEEIDNNDIEDTNFMIENKTMSMQIAVTGIQSNEKGGNIIYNGNGATSGGMLSNVISANNNVNLAENNYKKAYMVNLDTNGGDCDSKKVVCEYKFSHWSTDSRNSNVLYYSEKEIDSINTMWGVKNCEYIQYVNLVRYIDEYGLEDYYFLSFDIKSTDVSKRSSMCCYMQSGSGAKYHFAPSNRLYFDVTTEYQHKIFNRKIETGESGYSSSILSFYGEYGTGNKPIAKNVTFDIGSGYENLQEINYSDIANNSTVLNLYAKWIPQSVTLPTPTKEGYTFLGWYTEKDGGTKVNNTYTPTEDITLYAHWQ